MASKASEHALGDAHKKLEHELDAMTLQQAWTTVARAWTERRRNPDPWRLIANHVVLVALLQREGLDKAGA